MTNAELIALIDLTRLNDHDSTAAVKMFCEQAHTPLGPVAAVCVYPQYIPAAKAALGDSNIPIATVANFPAGEDSLAVTLQSIEHSIQRGAHEIDVVLPYHQLQQDNLDFVTEFLHGCREHSQGLPLKVIIESGVLTPEQITQATLLVADAGADFVKTSTGKVTHGASLEAVETILQSLSAHTNPPGIKISGGVRTAEQAQAYIELIERYMGAAWINSQHVRIGASQLLQTLLEQS